MSAISNARWVFTSHVARTILYLAGLAALARLLSPSDFGLMAMATIVVAFANILQDLGTSAAIVQKKAITQTAKSTVFWLNLLVGCLLGLTMWASAELLSRWFRAPSLEQLVGLVSLAMPLQSASSVHVALLERENRFRAIATVEFLSSLCGLLAAIGLALRGVGPAALAWQLVATSGIATLLYWSCALWRPTFAWSGQELRAIVRYASHLTAFSLVGFLSRNGDAFIVGRFLGEAALGTYSQGLRLMSYPVQSFTFVAARALFPVMSRQQDVPREMASLYFQALHVVCAITSPLLLGLWLVREQAVHVLLGSQWSAVAAVLFWLAPVGLLQSLVSTTGTVFKATGRTDLLLASGLIGAALHITCFLIGVRYGLEGVAAAYLLATILNAIPCFALTHKALAGRWSHLLQAVSGPWASAVAMVLLLLPLREVASAYSPVAVLIVCVPTGAAIYGGALYVFSRKTWTAIGALAR